MKFISKFGSKNGAGVYNALKEDARKIYKKPQIENSQKGDVKRIAAPNSAKSRPATQGDEQKLDEREKTQTELNLSGDVLQAQCVSAKEQNLENRLQNVQNLEPEKLQSLERKNSSAAIEKVKVAESNLSDKLASTERSKDTKIEVSSENLNLDEKGQNLSNKRPPQKSKQAPTPQNEVKNKAENTAKAQPSIKIDEAKKQEIRKIAFESKNLGDFHNGLVKKYGAEDAGKLYKALKQKAKEYLSKRNAAK